MMTWNYRVFQESDGDYVIREVFYDEGGSLIACTEKPVEPFGRSLVELAQSLEDFQQALSLPVLTMADLPKPSPTNPNRLSRHTISQTQLRAKLGLTETAQPIQGAL